MHIQQTSIHLDNLRIYAYHGVLPQERMTGSYFLVSLTLATNFSQAVESDDLYHTISYADVFERIVEEMRIPSQLLEHVAGRIAQRLYNDFPSITEIKIRLDKENPPMGAQCQSCGIDLFTTR